MHVAQIGFAQLPADCMPAQILDRWPSLGDIADAAASGGVRVTVLQAAHAEERLSRAGVEYEFIASRVTDSIEARVRQFAAVLDEVGADLLHIHGLGFAENAAALARHMPKLPILFQDHADQLPRWWRRPRWRRWYGIAAGAAFTCADLARPYTEAGMFAPQARLFSIAESSSRFTPGSRAQARAATGLYGDPCILWVGHLRPGKDPLTVLKGVAAALEQLPGLQLWCAYGSSELLASVRRRIADDSRLAGRVHLLGSVEHHRVQLLMRSADLFVSGSHAESCGYSLLEALASGIWPVVTDIPAHNALTGGGRVGHLWRCGDATGLAAALVAATKVSLRSTSVRAHFDQELSFTAVGRRWAAAYELVCRASGPVVP